MRLIGESHTARRNISLEKNPSGIETKWHNPDSGNYGSVAVTKNAGSRATIA
jgi:surface antigen